MDRIFMSAALALAASGLGATWPNPSVGCVIVDRNGHIAGRARTGTSGRPHAETRALAMAGAAARGATAYVTLEPCSHYGHTPPCADALIEAGIARVVVAAGDPDPRVNGQGIARLREAGLAVQTGFMETEAQETLAGFLARVRLGRPLVTLKLAGTLDGRIATGTGQSQWITGPQARRAVQALRGRQDAVMVGAGTVLADDPDLSCRLAGYAHRPTVRIVADGGLRTPRSARLIASTHANPTWLLYHTDSLPEGENGHPPGEIPPSRAQLLAEAGARCILVAKGPHGIDLGAALAALGTRGLTRVLVEGGGRLAASLLRDDLVDRVVWFAAPGVLGADALAAVAPLGIEDLAGMRRFVPAPRGPSVLGADLMTEFLRKD
jgi:diaminohydroxyphosphoribosylaminopyrimidine deaminase/5-amino-6-(5-phosphoribosylamino)uracil reductase